jgi:hypothetical protein
MEEWVGELMKMVNPLYAGVRWPRRVERGLQRTALRIGFASVVKTRRRVGWFRCV